MPKFVITKHSKQRLKERIFVDGAERQKTFCLNAYKKGLKPDDINNFHLKGWVYSQKNKTKGFKRYKRKRRFMETYEYILYKNALLVMLKTGRNEFTVITVIAMPESLKSRMNQSDESELEYLRTV